MATSVSPDREAPHQTSARTATRRVRATPTEVSAAKLRLVLDERLGRATPEWVVRLANAERPSA
ncbi:hypothetical protein GB881_04985 [Georgenia subflava]|uniref:Uncharacterized protein n=1 Tax=Georgenia subflava TaxID=1622177 RepID=A0A6N7EG88_9MICO|nr:hypothetical protein [Georgenia subflava]